MSIVRRTLIDSVVLVLIIVVVYPLILYFFIKPPGKDDVASSIRLVDIQKVFLSSMQGKEEYSSLQQKISKRTDEIKSLTAKAQGMQAEIQGLLRQGRNGEAQQKMPAFQKTQTQLASLQQEASQEIQKAQNEMDKSFLSQLKMAVDQVRQEEHVAIVQAIDPIKTLSYDTNLDITPKVLAKFNQLYPGKPVVEDKKK